MHFLTQQETHNWLGKTPLSVQTDRNDLSFPTAQTFCFRLELPTKIYRVSNFVNYLLPYEQGSLSCRSLLWFTDWGMWNDVHERAGMFMLEQMRAARGEYKPLIEKPGKLFDNSEAIALQSFLIIPVLFVGMRIWHLRVANSLYSTVTTNPCMSFLKRKKHSNGCFKTCKHGTQNGHNRPVDHQGLLQSSPLLGFCPISRAFSECRLP